MKPTHYQQNIQDLIDAIPDMIFVMHRDGTILEIHGEDPEMLIAPKEELVGTSIKDFFEEEEYLRHIKMYEQCIISKKIGTIGFELSINNQILNFESRIKPLDADRLLTIVRDISSQKKLMEAHEEELAYRKFLFKNDNNGLAIFNSEHRVIDVNPQFCRMTGYSADELKTMYTWDLDALSAKQDIVKSFNINQYFDRTFTSRHRRKDGSTYDVEVSAISFHWQGERFVYTSCRNITERNLVNQDLLNTKANLTAIVENTLDSIWSINTKYEITYINEVFANDFLATFGVLLKPGINILESLPGELQPTWKSRYDHVLSGKRTLFEDVIDTVGASIYIEVAANPIIRNKEIIGVSFFGRNISERKLAEKQLITQKQYLETILQTTVDGFWVVNLTGEITQINEAYSKMSGYSMEELLKMKINDIDSIEEPEETKARISWIIKHGSKIFETKHRRKDGSVFDVEISVNYLELDEGKLVCFCRDITERKLAEEALQESNRLKTAFINNISHEVRTPLNGILGFGNLIMEEDLSNAKKQDYYTLLQHSSERLQQTITDIIDISEVTAGSINPEKNNVPLAELINNLAETTRDACSKKNVLVTPEVPLQHENLVLQTDAELLVKIMKQLLSNAEKFTLTGRIKLGYEVKDSWVHFHVKDTGQGIAADKLNLMFEPFTQEDVAVTRGHEGSGLGLAIARRLVELLGGKLWAESEKGVGSTFFFTLPFVAAELPAEPDDPAKPHSKKSDGAGKNLVLIAEDEESNYQLLKTVAENAGYSTLHAIHGAEAVELCHQYPEIGLILMDIKMPVMNGLEATKHIKAFRPDLPIIALTAHAQTGDRQRMLNAGCDEYLAKPVNIQELNALINTMLTR
jgi:PAS domain S-box-containing protein